MSEMPIDTQQLVVWVNQLRYPMHQVEQLSGMTRQGIWKRLRSVGCLIPRRAKGGAPGVMIEVRCAWCNTTLKRRKRRLLKLDILRSFCNAECYYASLEAPGYFPWRQGSRLARTIVAQYFALLPEHVVHHKDGDQRHNDRANLAVYASQADHLKHHRGREIQALWDGAE